MRVSFSKPHEYQHPVECVGKHSARAVIGWEYHFATTWQVFSSGRFARLSETVCWDPGLWGWVKRQTGKTLRCALRVTVKIEVQVYSLVSSTKRYSPDFTQLPPGHRTCSFISHLNSPRSIQPGCHFRRTGLFNAQAFTVLPGTQSFLGRRSARVGKVPCLEAQCRSIIQRSRGSNTRSLAYKSRTLPLSRDAPRKGTMTALKCWRLMDTQGIRAL